MGAVLFTAAPPGLCQAEVAHLAHSTGSPSRITASKREPQPGELSTASSPCDLRAEPSHKAGEPWQNLAQEHTATLSSPCTWGQVLLVPTEGSAPGSQEQDRSVSLWQSFVLLAQSFTCVVN